jgi:anaerobic dimethyl sulfoxide reductase subunit B (iron-sulfur subunit)
MSDAFFLDIDRCTGCFACTVACMDQNDIDVGERPTAWRQVFTVETGAFPDAHLRYISLACMHCEDAPCLYACPTGALQRSPDSRVVRVEAERCIGCHSCSIACPFGVPRYGADGKMQKCDLCEERLRNDLEPACVRVCPTRALKHGDPNDLGLSVQRRRARRLAAETESTGQQC